MRAVCWFWTRGLFQCSSEVWCTDAGFCTYMLPSVTVSPLFARHIGLHFVTVNSPTSIMITGLLLQLLLLCALGYCTVDLWAWRFDSWLPCCQGVQQCDMDQRLGWVWNLKTESGLCLMAPGPYRKDQGFTANISGFVWDSFLLLLELMWRFFSPVTGFLKAIVRFWGSLDWRILAWLLSSVPEAPCAGTAGPTFKPSGLTRFFFHLPFVLNWLPSGESYPPIDCFFFSPSSLQWSAARSWDYYGA